MKNRNIEIMSRFTNDTSSNKNIQEIIKYYEEKSINVVPCFVKLETSLETPPGIVQEYKKILKRLDPNSSYKHANAKYILGKVESDLRNVQVFLFQRTRGTRNY